jgi:hypothetical protein
VVSSISSGVWQQFAYDLGAWSLSQVVTLLGNNDGVFTCIPFFMYFTHMQFVTNVIDAAVA